MNFPLPGPYSRFSPKAARADFDAAMTAVQVDADSVFAEANRAAIGSPATAGVDLSAPIGYYSFESEEFSETPFPDEPLLEIVGDAASFHVTAGSWGEGQSAVYALTRSDVSDILVGVEMTFNNAASIDDWIEIDALTRDTASGELSIMYGSQAGSIGTVGDFWRSDASVSANAGHEIVGVIAVADSSGEGQYAIPTVLSSGYEFGVAVSTAPGAFASGFGTASTGSFSHAEGFETVASSKAAHAEGTSTTASQRDAHAEGNSTQATGHGSHAEGWFTVASGQYSHAEGTRTTASNSSSHAEGVRTTATDAAGHAEGLGSIAAHQASHAEGMRAYSRQPGGHASGSIGPSATDLYPNALDDLRIQYSRYSRFNTTTNATATPVPASGGYFAVGPDMGGFSDTMPAYPANRRLAIAFQIEVSALRLDSTAEAKVFTVKGGMLWNANSATLLGTPTVEAFGTPTWTITVSATSRGPVLTCVGEAAKTIRWNASFHLTENPLPLT